MFINYGFVTRTVHRLMHPRADAPSLGRVQRKRADAILRFVAARGAVHPRDLDAEFAHGTVTNYWGGSSNATTHLLDLLHYGGKLRVVRRDAGIRVYALPLLWGDRVIGWANVSSLNAMLHANSGYVAGQRPRGRTFNRELDLELDRLREFLK